MIILLLLFVEIGVSSLYGFGVAIVAIIVGLWLWKSGLPAALFTSQDNLLKARTLERDDLIKEKDGLKKEVEEWREENKTLRREITQRYEIHHEDQAKIRELKEELWKLQRE